jgi:AraC-like DNA-binding protein
MATMKAWMALASRVAAAPPLHFVHGMRHTVARGVCCEVHSHREIEIVFHPTGRGVSRTSGAADMAFAEGDAVIYGASQPHDQVMAAPGEDFCVQIALPARGGAVPRSGFHVAGLDDPSLLEDLRALSQDRVRVSRAEQVILNLRATSTLCMLIHLASTRQPTTGSSRSEHHVRAVEQFIRENFATLRSLRAAAEATGVGYDHLRHLFKERRGRSLVHYLNEVRMERAKTLLVHSRLPLKQIATMCGFRDEYYFSAVFRRHVRMPPGRYRAAGLSGCARVRRRTRAKSRRCV